MLDKIKVYAPKTYEALLKIVTTNENAKKKISDYEQRIQALDKEIAEFEVKSIKDPGNSKLNDNLEDLSAKRYGLMSRYESILNGDINFISKEDVNNLLKVFIKEYTEIICARKNENSLKYQKLHTKLLEDQKKLQDEYGKKYSEIQSEDYVLTDITDIMTQTLTKYLLKANIPSNEVNQIMNSSGLPFDGKTTRSL